MNNAILKIYHSYYERQQIFSTTCDKCTAKKDEQQKTSYVYSQIHV